MNIQFDNYDNKSKTDTLKFDVLNCNSSFVNTLRRIIICDITTVGFNTEHYANSDIKIIENTSSLHNEFILHRIGLIPVNTSDIETFDETKYKFILNIENTTNAPIDVTTKDIQIQNLETNSLESNEKFFPKNPITNDHILITRLKPTPYGNGDKIHLEGKSSKGMGKDHIRYSPVSNVVFTNKINPERELSEFKKYVEKHSDI
jgi:DNA-directed RNA polymerase II subunit RPB3